MTIAAPAKLHPTTQYAADALSGEVVAGEMVRLACSRHMRDLRRQNKPGFPYHFDEDAASDAFDFFAILRHYEGEFDGLPFILNDWQRFVIGSLYGWKKKDGYRRFRTAYIETAKGSGKSPLAAGVGLKGLCDDDEPGAQVFAAASMRAQSDIIFRDARLMALASPALARRLTILEHNISFPAGNGYFRPVSSEAGNLTGKRPHVGVLDEIHEHKDAVVVNAMRKGTKARKQPLIFEITNSGQDRNSIAWEHHSYSAKVLRGVAIDETWFAYVCGLDICETHKGEGKDMPVDGCETGCDQWQDEATWPKANPSIDETPGWDYLRGLVNEAANMPSQQDDAKRMNFCIWVSGRSKWMRPEVIQSQEPRREIAPARVGFAGYDLSAVNDITAAAYVFRDDDGDGIDIILRAFLPEGRIDELAKASGVPYRRWADEGHLILTPGDTINYDFVEAEDERIREMYEIRSAGIDPWQSIQFRATLEGKGIQIVKVPQTNQRLHAPVEEAERLLKLHGFRYAPNPIIEWVASNTVLHIDGHGMKRIDKAASSEKIDPIAAILNALSEALVAHEEAGPVSVMFA